MLVRSKDPEKSIGYLAVDIRRREVCGYAAVSVGPKARDAGRTPAWARSPAVLNGRAVVETEAGLVCLKGRL